MKLKLALPLCLIATTLYVRAAHAQLDPFEFEVYPAQTVGDGMIELESLNGFVPNGHSQGYEGSSSGQYASNLMYRTALEFTYGLSDKVEAAAYLNLAHPSGASFQYAGSKYRLRGSLFEQGEMPVDLGWYIELEWNRVQQFDDNELEIELKPIIEKDIGRWEFDLNPKVEKAIFIGPNKNRGFEFGYAMGTYYNWRRMISPGLEFYGGIGLIDDSDPLREQQHYIFQVVRGEFSNGLEYSIGPGIGLTSGSDRVILKFNLEFERYVGALFG